MVARLGRIPRVGDSVDVDGHRLTVLAMDGLRIAELEARPAAPEPPREIPAEGSGGIAQE